METRDGIRLGIGLMQQTAKLMGAVPGSNLFYDCREFDRKLEAFRLYQYADRELGIPVDRFPIDEVVRRALNLEAFRAIWILEGIGRILSLNAGLQVEGLLNSGPASLVPDQALVPLHAGMGMAFSEKLFSRLGSNPSNTEVRLTVERFIDMCRANCRPGWEDACIEPVGFLVRALHANLVASACDAMEAVRPEFRRLYWHGVGRSIYFAPTGFLPIPRAHERMVRWAASVGSRADDSSQALAGLFWAVTLVNLPQPDVITSLISISSELEHKGEFTNGLISALLAWRHMAPGDSSYLRPYADRMPSHDRDGAMWETWIGTPVRDALANLYSGLAGNNRIPALYTYRTREELRELSGATCEEQNTNDRQQPQGTVGSAGH